LARAVYTVTDFDVYNEGQLNIDGYLLDSIYEDDTGLKAALFVNGDDKVLAFAGTDLMSGADWSTNGNQAYGHDTAQYNSGIRYAASISGNLVLTGHSMGGGIAAAAAIITGRDATTFNAADVHTNTLRGFKYRKGSINHYFSHNDGLQRLNRFTPGTLYGTRHQVLHGGTHSIDSLCSAMGC
jgi:hypothetical protein